MLDARLVELGFRGAIVGPHGSGKTTLLNDLEHRLSRCGHRVVRFMLTDEIRRIPDSFYTICNLGCTVFLDGAEQLLPRDWRAFLRRTDGCRGLIVTSHRPGLLPTLVECSTSPELLDQLLNDLLTPEVRDGLGDLPLRSWRNGRGNLHLVLSELYHCVSEKQIFCTLPE